MNILSKKLKLKLQERNISAHALEKLAGLKQSAIHNILNGKSKNPTIHTLQAISKALDCSLEEILDNTFIDEKSTNAQIRWNGELYYEAVGIANRLFLSHDFQPNKEEALNYIDEIYLYSLQDNCNHIDQRFAEWLIKSWLFKKRL